MNIYDNGGIFRRIHISYAWTWPYTLQILENATGKKGSSVGHSNRKVSQHTAPKEDKDDEEDEEEEDTACIWCMEEGGDVYR